MHMMRRACGTSAYPATMSTIGESPKTYLFRTREGSSGIVQIVQVEDGTPPRHMRIRYRLLTASVNPATQPAR
jgi:hypothetical protein